MFQDEQKKSYLIATLGIIASLILGSLDKSWSTPRIVAFAGCIIVALVSVISAIRKR